MNKQWLSKIGPIVGLAISLSTTSFAGYKIFAAASEQHAVVPSLPSPTPTPGVEIQEVVETVVIDGSTGASGASGVSNASGATGSSGATNFSVVTKATGSFDDSDDDRITLEDDESEDNEKKEGDHESDSEEDAPDR